MVHRAIIKEIDQSTYMYFVCTTVNEISTLVLCPKGYPD